METIALDTVGTERVEDVGTATEALKAHGMRVTPQRIAVYDALVPRKDHPSVDQIYTQVKERCPTISLNTVYTTLTMMAKAELIRQIDAGDGLCRYDGNPRPHLHIVCTDCHRVDDLDLDMTADAKSLLQRAADTSGYDINDYAIYFYGCCPSCRR